MQATFTATAYRLTLWAAHAVADASRSTGWTVSVLTTGSTHRPYAGITIRIPVTTYRPPTDQTARASESTARPYAGATPRHS